MLAARLTAQLLSGPPNEPVPPGVTVRALGQGAASAAAARRLRGRTGAVPALDRHWPGTPAGLAAVRRLAGG